MSTETTAAVREAATTPEQQVAILEWQNRRMAATLKLFADPFNWEGDIRWAPMRVTVEANLPSELAATALKECGR